jgi:hypothetical protein
MGVIAEAATQFADAPGHDLFRPVTVATHVLDDLPTLDHLSWVLGEQLEQRDGLGAQLARSAWPGHPPLAGCDPVISDQEFLMC